MRTTFITANIITGSSPHHLSAAICLSKDHALTILGPDDTANRTGQDEIARLFLNPPSISLIPRSNWVISRILFYPTLLLFVLKSLMDRSRFVYIYGSQAAFLVILLPLFRLLSCRIVYHTQDYLEPWKYPLRATLEALCCRAADLVIINEENRARVLQSNYALKTTPSVVTTGLLRNWPIPAANRDNRSRFIARFFPDIDPNNIVIIIHQGPLREERCGSAIVQSMDLLPDNYCLVVTGGSNPNVEDFGNVLGSNLRRRIVDVGKLDFQEILDLTNLAQVGLLLYPNDGIGNFYQCPGRLSENLRCGVPTVASHFPPFRLKELRCSAIKTCNPYDPQSISIAIRYFAEKSFDEKQAISEAARAYAEANTSFDKEFSSVSRVFAEWDVR